MKLRILCLAALLIVTASCQKDPTPETSVSAPAGVLLGGVEGAVARFDMDASESWTAQVSGTGFTIEPTSGEAGKATLTVIATAENDVPERTALGSVTLTAKGSSTPVQVEVIQRPATAPQTICFYLSGRGNLLSAFDGNISHALKALRMNIAGDSRMLVFRQTGFSESHISELYYDPYTRRGVEMVVKEYDDNPVSTDPQTMTRILNDMLVAAPAQQYGLILGSHAMGWVPESAGDVRAPGLTPYEDPYWKKIDQNATRWFGLDTYRSMDTEDLARSITAAAHPFEYLIFDACFMSSVEALYDLRDAARHIIASPCEIMLYGMPYDIILPHLLLDNGTKYNLQAFCEGFHDFYSTTSATQKSGCIAMTITAEFDALVTVMQEINRGTRKQYDPTTLQIYEGLSPHLFFDLKHYVESSCGDEALLERFLTQFDKTFPAAYRLHTPSFYTAYSAQHIPVEHYGGVSVSEPSQQFSDENRQTAWYKDTH